jgi:hypothetical protein
MQRRRTVIRRAVTATPATVTTFNVARRVWRMRRSTEEVNQKPPYHK